MTIEFPFKNYRPWELHEVPVGRWLRQKEAIERRYLILGVDESIVHVLAEQFTTLQLFEGFTQANGEPCGIKVGH